MTTKEKVSGTVYFDNAATTPPLPEVVARLAELNSTVFGNASSAHHKGRQAQEVLDGAQQTLAELFRVPPSHIVFTSGGTESNNLAIWGGLGGLVQAFQWIRNGGQGKIVTSTVEHDATKRVCQSLQQMGAPVAWIDVDQEGILRLDQLEREATERIRIVSIHHVQNEVGTLQDIRAISELVRASQPDALIHVDGVQSFMKIPVDLEKLGVDLFTISGHKIGGPKGVGALILGRRLENRNPKIGPLILGPMAQQFGIRPGTVPVPAIGAFVTAIEWNRRNLEANTKKLLSLRRRLIDSLPPQAELNGPNDVSDSSRHRAPQTVNFSLRGLPSAVAVEALSARGFCVSAGSACHSTNPQPNETILKMGLGRERALSAIRVSFSPQNTPEEVDAFQSSLTEILRQFA